MTEKSLVSYTKKMNLTMANFFSPCSYLYLKKVMIVFIQKILILKFMHMQCCFRVVIVY